MFGSCNHSAFLQYIHSHQALYKFSTTWMRNWVYAHRISRQFICILQHPTDQQGVNITKKGKHFAVKCEWMNEYIILCLKRWRFTILTISGLWIPWKLKLYVSSSFTALWLSSSLPMSCITVYINQCCHHPITDAYGRRAISIYTILPVPQQHCAFILAKAHAALTILALALEWRI